MLYRIFKKMDEVTATEKDCKKFVRRSFKVNGIIFRIVRIMKDGSGIDIEQKKCPSCALKYYGARLKIKYNETIEFICPICSK